MKQPLPEAPLHILGGAEKRLRLKGQAKHGTYLVIRNRRPAGKVRREVGEDRPGRSGHHPLLPDRGMMGNHTSRAAQENPPVRLHRAVHQPLVQTPDRLHDGLGRVGRAFPEHDPRSFRGDHLLDEDRHFTFRRRQPQLLPVEQRPVRPQGSEDEPHVVQHGGRPLDVQKRFVQSRERGLYPVFPRGRGTHRDRTVPEGRTDPLAKCSVQVDRPRGTVKERADPKRRVPDLFPPHVLEPLAPEFPRDRAAQAPRLDEPAVRFGRHAKSLRYPKAGCTKTCQSKGLPPDEGAVRPRRLLDWQKNLHRRTWSSETDWKRLTT